MRFLKFAAAIAMMAGSIGLTTSAEAQHDRRDHIERRGDVRHGDRRYDRGHDRRYDRHYNRSRRYDARRRDGYRNARHCRTEWRHHRRIRVCR